MHHTPNMHTTTKTEKIQHEETSIFILNILFLVALVTCVIVVPIKGVSFSAFTISTSFIISSIFIYFS